MAAPFDDQLVIDCLESGTVAYLDGSTASVAGVTIDEQAVQTIFAGVLSLTAKDALITMGFTQCPARPQEGGTYTSGTDGIVWKIVSVLKRTLGSFWEITGRTFAVPGGLTQSGTLARRTNAARASGLSKETHTPYAHAQACRRVPMGQTAELGGERPTETILAEQVVMAGVREIRVGDIFYDDTDITTLWDVVSTQPVDLSTGLQVFDIQRRI